MASTYSALKLQLMTTGENTGTWGSITNVNLGTAIEEALVGSANISFSGADITLPFTNTNSSQTARKLRLVLTGVSNGPRQLVVPAIEKTYIVKNDLTDPCTIKVSGGTGVVVPAGRTMYLYNNGTDVTDPISYLSSLALASALPVASGGTGMNTPGTAGNVLTSNGTAWVSQVLDLSAYVLKTTTVTGTGGLTGGGDLSTNRTISIASTSNGYGTRTISTSTPSGGNDGDIWYQV